jgi:hypothetical protein
MPPIQLSHFTTIDFQDVRPQLLFSERRDTKYLFHYKEALEILNDLKDNYIIVLHGEQNSQQYSTVYYDTDELDFYKAHHNGHGNRKKMRIRTYEDGQAFLEWKQKTNKGITQKQRTTTIDAIPDDLIPQIEVRYNRITMYSKTFEEKLTFDFHLNFIREDESIRIDEIVIAESKRAKNASSVFIDSMKKRKILSTSFSKYCFGIASLHTSIKKNNFKQLIVQTNKLKNEYDISSNY